MSVDGTAASTAQKNQTRQPARQTVPKPSANTKNETDWNALIEAAIAKKKVPAVSIDIKMKKNEDEIAAFKTMQNLMQNLEASVGKIRGTDNSLTKKDDIFSVRKAYLTGKGNIDAKSAVVVTAENGSGVRTYDLKVLQIATAHKVAGKAFSEANKDLNLQGQFSLKLEGATDSSVNFDIRKDMSLAEIAETINGKSTTTGISASVVKVADGEFKMVLNGNQTGKKIVMTSVSGTDIGKALGVVADSGDFSNQLQSAKGSIIELDGVRIARDSNVVNDAIKGVTFSLYKETGASDSISVEVAQSLSDISSAIKTFVEAYNAYRQWALTQQAMASGGGASKDAILFGDSILRTANSSVANALSTTVDEKSMALLGMSYDSRNLLQVDAQKLNNALVNDLTSVEKLLNFQMTSTSNDIKLLTRNDKLPQKLTLDIRTDSNGKISSVTADGKSGLFVISGQRIQGVEGSDYEGVTFVFTGKKDTKAELTFSAGMVERLHHTLAKFSGGQNGLVQKEITKLSSENKDYLSRYNKIISDVGDHQKRLIKLYSVYQKEIERAKSSLDYLKAILGTGNN